MEVSSGAMKVAANNREMKVHMYNNTAGILQVNLGPLGTRREELYLIHDFMLGLSSPMTCGAYAIGPLRSR